MSTTPAPEYRIEWTGRIKVYVPVRPESVPDEDQMAWAAYQHARYEADQ